MSKNPYTPVEEELMKALTKAVHCFNQLEMTHPCHGVDFRDGIHKCQDVIINRIVQRDYPEVFPSYKVTNHDKTNKNT